MLFSDLATLAGQLIGSFSAGESPSTDDLALMMSLANVMIDHWNSQRLSLYTIQPTTVPFVGGTVSYVLAPRPVSIENASVVQNATSLRWPLDLMNAEEWAGLSERTNQALVPKRMYYDGDLAAPTVFLNPVPSSSAYSLEFMAWKLLTAFVTTGDVVNFPTGYLKPLLYNLAVMIAPAFGAQVNPDIVAQAVQSKQDLMTLNAQLIPGPIQAGTLGEIPARGLPTAQSAPQPGAPPQQP